LTTRSAVLALRAVSLVARADIVGAVESGWVAKF
jgi:hypothetical protein